MTAELLDIIPVLIKLSNRNIILHDVLLHPFDPNSRKRMDHLWVRIILNFCIFSFAMLLQCIQSDREFIRLSVSFAFHHIFTPSYTLIRHIFVAGWQYLLKIEILIITFVYWNCNTIGQVAARKLETRGLSSDFHCSISLNFLQISLPVAIVKKHIYRSTVVLASTVIALHFVTSAAFLWSSLKWQVL